MKNLSLFPILIFSIIASSTSLPATQTQPTLHTNNRNSPIEQPAKLHNRPEQIVIHTGYRLSYNNETLCPNWVAWELTAHETAGTARRSNDFRADPAIPRVYQVTSEDYNHSGYDRGHMCPSADMKWNSIAQSESFFMSNICPQLHSINSGAWEKLERACRRWAKREDKVYIVCGPIYNASRKALYVGKYKKIRVPNAFFKVVLSLKPGKEKAIGFYYTNRRNKQNMADAAKSVDEIEQITGIDFFPQLNNSLENRIEAKYSLSEWH